MKFGVFDHLDRNDLLLKEIYEARLAQISRKSKTLGFGYRSRQGAKHALSGVEGTRSDRPKACHPERMRGI